MKIIIAGNANEGKSWMAAFIYKKLFEIGYDMSKVDLNDTNHALATDFVAPNALTPAQLVLREEKVRQAILSKDMPVIEIDTQVASQLSSSISKYVGDRLRHDIYDDERIFKTNSDN